MNKPKKFKKGSVAPTKSIAEIRAKLEERQEGVRSWIDAKSDPTLAMIVRQTYSDMGVAIELLTELEKALPLIIAINKSNILAQGTDVFRQAIVLQLVKAVEEIAHSRDAEALGHLKKSLGSLGLTAATLGLPVKWSDFKEAAEAGKAIWELKEAHLTRFRQQQAVVASSFLSWNTRLQDLLSAWNTGALHILSSLKKKTLSPAQVDAELSSRGKKAIQTW